MNITYHAKKITKFINIGVVVEAYPVAYFIDVKYLGNDFTKENRENMTNDIKKNVSKELDNLM